MFRNLFQQIKQNHFLAMAICCATPMIALVLLSPLGLIGSWGVYAFLLLCPLGHIFMMRGMHSKSCGNATTQTVEMKQIEHK
jgi:hypothetical protein